MIRDIDVSMNHFLQGVNLLEPTMTPTVTVTRILRDVLQIPIPRMAKLQNHVEKINLAASDPVIRTNAIINQKLVRIVGENILGAGYYHAEMVEDSPPANLTSTLISKKQCGK